jgi:hypothetical protein
VIAHGQTPLLAIRMMEAVAMDVVVGVHPPLHLQLHHLLQVSPCTVLKQKT